MRITVISDTHTRHGLIPLTDLPGGDILIHAGDIMNSGYNKNDIHNFCTWFQSLKQYEDKFFIAGNHDRLFELEPEVVKGYLKNYPMIDYLQDEQVTMYFDGPNGDFPEDNIRIYGLPHTPEFYSWAFNIPRGSQEMRDIMNNIPKRTDILITHGPPYGILDTISSENDQSLGCMDLLNRIKEIKPKIHVFGHIHGGRGIECIDGTLFINASVLNEQYEYTNKPITLDFDFITGEYEILVK